ENKIMISVIDTGKGIPKEVIPNLFEKFTTRGTHDDAEKGTGLGLFICKGIVEAHNGTISGSNNENGGATFSITLPLGIEPTKLADSSSRISTPSILGMSVAQ